MPAKLGSDRAPVKKPAGRMPSIRITGGEWRSRVLQSSTNQEITRPTMDQTRLAVFNILNSAAWALQSNGQPLLMNANVLDGFAGSGAYGFEALSRGAMQATLIENDKHAATACQVNAEHLKCTAQTKIMRNDITTIGMNTQSSVRICFLDPPYDFTAWADLLNHLQQRNWIDSKTLLVLESNSKISREFNEDVDGVLSVHDQRRYGHALITFAQIS